MKKQKAVKTHAVGVDFPLIQIKAKPFGRYRKFPEIVMLLITDIAAVACAFSLAALIRTDLLPLLYEGFSQEITFNKFRSIWWMFAVWLSFFYYEGLYTKKYSFWDEIRELCKISVFSTTAVFVIVSLGQLNAVVSRTVIILMGFFAMFILPLVRLSSKKMLRAFGFFRRRALIIGAGETGKLILNALRNEPNYGYDVVGFVDDDPEKIGSMIEEVRVYKGVEKAEKYIRHCSISDVFIAMPGARKAKLQGLINRLQHKVESLLFVPDMFGIAVLGMDLQHFFHEQAFAFELKNNLARPLNVFVKRCFDILVSILLLPLILVLILIFSIIIKIDSKGSVIFAQERIGRKGKKFKCYKFRTMDANAEEQLQNFLDYNENMKKDWEKYWKLKDDPRVTRIGRVLRGTSLDELPQIFNVLKGEMSLVGPRPYLLKEEDYLAESKEIILSVLPGVTGLWQVRGRSSTTHTKRIALDAWYVRNWNLWLDIMIIFKTIRVVLRKESAY